MVPSPSEKEMGAPSISMAIKTRNKQMPDITPPLFVSGARPRQGTNPWFYIAFQRCLSTAKKAVFSMGLKASRRDICGLLFAFVQGAVFGSIFFLGK